MKVLATTNRGMEDVAADELKYLKGFKAEIKTGFVLFEVEKYEDIFELCYLSRTLTKIIVLFGSFIFENDFEKELKNKIDTLEIKEFIKEQKFAVDGERHGEHSFNSQEITKEINAILKNRGGEIDYKAPQTRVYFYILDKEFYFGIDFSGEDLGRRDYRIFLSSQSIKGNVAFALLMLADYQKKETLIDPFCREGAIPIEAALYASKKSPHFYRKEKFAFRALKKFVDFDFEKFFKKTDSQIKEDSLSIYAIDDNFRSIQASKKNSLIAGVKNFEFSRQDMKWLDSKFKKNELDVICTFPLQYSQSKDSKQIDKIYKQLFYQAEYLLNKKGRIVLFMRTVPEQVVKMWEEYKFVKKHERIIMQGKDVWNVVVLVKTSNP